MLSGGSLPLVCVGLCGKMLRGRHGGLWARIAEKNDIKLCKVIFGDLDPLELVEQAGANG